MNSEKSYDRNAIERDQEQDNLLESDKFDFEEEYELLITKALGNSRRYQNLMIMFYVFTVMSMSPLIYNLQLLTLTPDLECKDESTIWYSCT